MAKKIKPKIILISGKTQSGKNTVASFIETLCKPSYIIASLYYAKALKEMVARFSNYILGCHPALGYLSFEKEDVKKKVIPYKYNLNKCTYRKLLQFVGTEFMRNLFSDTIWVDIVVEEIKHLVKYNHVSMVLITDTRFRNEISRVKKVLGNTCDIITLRVERPKAKFKIKSFKDLVTVIKKVFKFKKEHISETALDKYKFDCVIVNDGTKKELKEKVKQFVDGLN